MRRIEWTLLVGASVALAGIVAACAPRGPTVIPFHPPREPITGLDLVEEGETEISGSVGAFVGYSAEYGVEVVPLDLILWAPPWSLGVNHGLERLELRVLAGQHLLGHQASLGVGYKLHSEGRWDVVADAALAASRYEDRFEVPRDDFVDTAGGSSEPAAQTNPSFAAREPGWYAYAYWVTAPSLRIRAVWRPNEQLSVPMAARVAHSRTGFGYGLFDFEQEQQNYVELSAGAVWKLPSTCLSLGGGVTATVYPVPAPLVMASASCELDWKDLRR